MQILMREARKPVPPCANGRSWAGGAPLPEGPPSAPKNSRVDSSKSIGKTCYRVPFNAHFHRKNWRTNESSQEICSTALFVGCWPVEFCQQVHEISS